MRFTEHAGREAGLAIALAALAAIGCYSAEKNPRVSTDPYVMHGPANFVTGYAATNDDGTINVVVEIPAGTNAKWEVDKKDGSLRWEFVDGRPRVVRYLGYPANYGMIPRTILPEALGGDGDPLDVVLLGPSLPRGAVYPARVIGVLALLDGGEQDDKLIAVSLDAALGGIRTLDDLDAQFPGVTTILEIWFKNYKGPGKIETGGFQGPERAGEILAAAMEAYETSR